MSGVTLPAEDTEYESGDEAVVSGWGSLYQDGPTPDVLMAVTVPIWTDSGKEVQMCMVLHLIFGISVSAVYSRFSSLSAILRQREHCGQHALCRRLREGLLPGRLGRSLDLQWGQRALRGHLLGIPVRGGGISRGLYTDIKVHWMDQYQQQQLNGLKTITQRRRN